MKSQINLNRVGPCIWFVIVIAIALLFSGCTTVSQHNIPVTDEVIIALQQIPNAQELYYYVSKTMTVRFTTKALTSSIINHEIHWDYSDINHTVRITPQTPGENHGNLSTSTLNIVFTTDEGATEVIFKRTGTGPTDSFEYFDVPDWNPPTPITGMYERTPFIVTWRNYPDDPPTLLVISQENLISR